MLSLLEHAADWLGDLLTLSTGLAVVRVPLERASKQTAKTLDIPGYLQINSYGCGGVAAATVVRYLKPGTPFGRAYDAVQPDPDLGTSIPVRCEGCGPVVSR